MPELLPDDPKSIAADIARELRESPQRWTQFVLSRDAAGKSLMHLDDCTQSPRAACWCLIGHIIRRTGPPTYDDPTRQLFRKVLGLGSGEGVANWNDAPGRTVDEVIELCEKVANG